MRGYLSPRFDWTWRGTASQPYVVAATYRSGSSYLSGLLWKTGRLGAPWEYFNYELEMELMQARLGSLDPDAYVEKLIEIRTSENGVFGIKSHFHHFSAALENSAKLRDMMEDAKFIYIDRRDKLAQAVSMAKAVQSGAWTSFGTPRKAPLFYSFEFIEACLDELRFQAEAWWSWFGRNSKTPHVVIYENLLEDQDGTIGRILDYVNPKHPGVSDVSITLPERQHDAVNLDWTRRFEDDWRARAVQQRTRRQGEI